MRFSILNWNVGGAKVLEQKTRQQREETRTRINTALNRLLSEYAPQPDVVTLQEIVRWQEPSDRSKKDLLDLSMVPGYSYFPFELIDSTLLSSKAKWNKIKNGSDWHPDTYFAQGNAFLIKDTTMRRHFPVWDLSNLDQEKPDYKDHFIERVNLDTGLYFGDRNTEPRAALVAHFICDPAQTPGQSHNNRQPLDIFVINVHLTTLMMEREGVPEIDTLAAKLRNAQLNVIFDGIVSRYNSWRQGGYRERGEKREERANFSLTEQVIRKLESKDISGNVIQRLKPIKDNAIGRENFLEELKKFLKEPQFEIFSPIILKYADKKQFETFKRHSPVWIIAGDFNFTEESAEYALIKRLNFIDTVPEQCKRTQFGTGTKASGAERNPTLTLDYIFAGPMFVSFDPAIKDDLHTNRVIHDHRVRASDHYPVSSTMEFIPK